MAQRLQLSPGGFGFSNDAGSELIALESLATPNRIHVAVCAGATAFPVSYTRHQTGRSTDNGRQVAANFGNIRGDLFRVIRGKAVPNQTCYLAPDSDLVATPVSVGPAAGSVCSPSITHRLAATERRRILHCWPMASAQPDAQIVAVQFAPLATNALASIVLITGSQLLVEDFPATSRGPDMETWRVDDGGIFSPGDFAILFLSRVRGTYVMGLTWAGAEGEDSSLLVADSANAFRTASGGYRYWAPN